jgi:Zn-finger nucleic acid-binding protein
MKYRIVKPIKRWPGVGRVVDTAPQVAKPWLDSGHLERVVEKKKKKRRAKK